MRGLLAVRTYNRLCVCITILILACIITGSACSQTPRRSSNPRLVEAPEEKKTTPTPVEVRLPSCPQAGSPALQSSTVTGHHKVTLSWNPSASSPDSDNNAVGYCLYRSKEKKVARKNPTCRDCERVNSMPVVGTVCVDDLVADGITYYYVVTGISSRGQLSSSSNETRVAVPTSKQSAGPASVGSSALCRGPLSSK